MVVHLSASAISQAVKTTREVVMAILKEIFVKIIYKKGYDIKLDMKIGYLHITSRGMVRFENYDFVKPEGEDEAE